jgi:hypothetical protein
MSESIDLGNARAAAATRKALDFLDKLTDVWADRIGLARYVARLAADPKPAAIDALLRQAYAEGAYEGYMAASEQPGTMEGAL